MRRTGFRSPARRTSPEAQRRRTEREENGHRVVIRSATDCRYDGGGPSTANGPGIPGPFFYNR